MVRAMLQTFPDVIQMRSISCHTLLHFAPAMKMNLVETNYFAEYVSSCRAAVHSVLADLAATRGGGNTHHIHISKVYPYMTSMWCRA